MAKATRKKLDKNAGVKEQSDTPPSVRYTVELTATQVAMITTALNVFTQVFIADYESNDNTINFPEEFVDKSLLEITATRMMFGDLFRSVANDYMNAAIDVNAPAELVEEFKVNLENIIKGGEL
jgi:hypothetical protein